MPTEQDINDLKTYLNEHIVAINIIDLIKWYAEKEDHLKARIIELERQLREAHLSNAENLFRGFDDD